MAGLRSFLLRHPASVELRSACATNSPPVNCSQTSRVQKPRFFVCDIERGAADAAVEGEGEGEGVEAKVTVKG